MQTPEGKEQISAAEPIGWYDRVKFAIVRGLLSGLLRLVGLNGLYWLCCAFGACEWLILAKVRRRVKTRLRDTLGDRLTDRQIAKATLRFFTRVRCDKTIYLVFDKIPKQKILERVEFENRHHIDETLQRGGGLYLMISHYGSNYLAGLLMALHGYRVAGVRDRKESALRRYVQARYALTFPEFRQLRMYFADAFPRGLYRSLRENWVVATALDVGRARAKNQGTVTMRLFGQEYTFLTGTAQIAVRSGSPIVQGFLISCRNFRFRLVVSEPLWDPQSGPQDESAALQQIMRGYAANIEDLLARHPCHISKF